MSHSEVKNFINQLFWQIELTQQKTKVQLISTLQLSLLDLADN